MDEATGRATETAKAPGPVAELMAGAAEDATPTPWEEARRRLAEADTYWLTTVRPDRRPHLVPVLAVWAGNALHLAAGGTTRKARNLARYPHCAVAASQDGLDLVLEGSAVRVRDPDRLRRVSAAYQEKYGWPTTVRGAALWGDGAPTAGPPPYQVYEVAAQVGFGLPTGELPPTRWRFPR